MLPGFESVVCPIADDRYYLLGLWVPKTRVADFLQVRDIVGECHNSRYAPSKPYPQMSLSIDGIVHNVGLHRLSFELFNGPLGTSNACHSCDNKRCVNPVHLFKGSTLDNVRDYIAKGGKIGGGQPWFPELLGEMIKLRAEGLTQDQIAARLKVTQKLVSDYLRKYAQ